MNKILVIGLGGTIGSVAGESISLDDNCLKILSVTEHKNVLFEGISPFKVLSENMAKELWQKLIDCLDEVDFSKYKGVIILHGSDTLAFTSAIIANAFADKNIVLVASDKPVENPLSNAKANFDAAVAHLLSDKSGVYVSYNGIKRANCITSADINDEFRAISHFPTPTGKKKISNKNVLIICFWLFMGIHKTVKLHVGIGCRSWKMISCGRLKPYKVLSRMDTEHIVGVMIWFPIFR